MGAQTHVLILTWELLEKQHVILLLVYLKKKSVCCKSWAASAFSFLGGGDIKLRTL